MACGCTHKPQPPQRAQPENCGFLLLVAAVTGYSADSAGAEPHGYARESQMRSPSPASMARPVMLWCVCSGASEPHKALPSRRQGSPWHQEGDPGTARGCELPALVHQTSRDFTLPSDQSIPC